MKILQVVHSFIPYTIAGTEVYTYTISKELLKRNEVFVFFRVNKPNEKEYSLTHNNFEGIETYTVNHTFNRCNSFEEMYSDTTIDQIFGKLLDRIKPDVIHIQHLLFLSLGVVKEAKKRNIPVIFTLNDYWLFCHKGQLLKNDLTICQVYNKSDCQICLISQLSVRKNTIFFYNILRRKLPNILLQLVKDIYLIFAEILFLTPDKSYKEIQKRYDYVKEVVSEVDLFIAPSNFIKEKFIKFGVPKDKICFCPYGIDYKNLHSIPKTNSKKIRFGYIGTLLPMKGVDILMYAFKKIKNKDTQLFVYGKAIPYAGYESYHKRLKKIAQNDERIRLMGYFDNKDIGRIMTNIDVLVVPSIWLENAPLVIQEAILSKTPVIASRVGGIPELINDSINGLLFNPGDVNELQKKLEYVTNTPEVIEKLRENGPKFKSIEDNAKEMEEIYTKIKFIYRMKVIQGVYDDKGNKIIFGRVESGILKLNNEVYLNLCKERGKVIAIRGNEKDKKESFAGECVGLKLSGVDYNRIERGEVCSDLYDKPPVKKEFSANVFILNGSIKKKDRLTIRCGTAERSCEIKEITKKINSENGRMIKENMMALSGTEAGEVRISTDEPLVIEKFSRFPPLGRFLLIKENKIISVGTII